MVIPTDAEVDRRGDEESWRFRLYVAGQSPKSLRAFGNLKSLCEKHIAGRYTIEIVDLIVHPERARDDGIVAIPTLVRRLPAPLRKIIGDLADDERVSIGLQFENVRPLGN